MAEHTVAELIARRHLIKYLFRKLNPSTAHTSPYSVELSSRIMELLGLRVQVSQSALKNPRSIRGRLPLSLVNNHLPDLDPMTHNKVMEEVEKLYKFELHKTVDDLHYGVPKQTKWEAIKFFRKQYGITEEDHPFASDDRSYCRYEASKHRRRKMGRPAGSRTKIKDDV